MGFLTQHVRQLLLFVILFTSISIASKKDEEILVIPYHYRANDEDIKLLKMDDCINSANWIENQKDIGIVLCAIKKYYRGPAYLCGYHWRFIHFKNNKPVKNYDVNVPCSKKTIGDALSPYYPDLNPNAAIYTIEIESKVNEADVINSINSNIGKVFSWSDEPYERYPKLVLKFELEKHKTKRAIHECINNIEALAKKIVSIEIDINRQWLLNEKKMRSGEIFLTLPIDFDHEIIGKIHVGDGFKLQYIKPESYRLYLVTKLKDIELIKKQVNVKGIISIKQHEIINQGD